jgi:undecaprenyl-diphosphatase
MTPESAPASPVSTSGNSGAGASSGRRRRPALARWAAWDALRETYRQSRLAWMTIPVGVKTRYAISLMSGFVACLILTAGLTLTAKWWAHHGLEAWDERVAHAIDRQTLLSVQNSILLESFGNLAYLIPLVSACAIISARRRRPLLAITFVVAWVAAKLIVLLGWLMWNRKRPDFILDGQSAPPLSSYPSGHVVLAMAVYGILAYLWIRVATSWLERVTAGVLALAIVCVTGLARLRLGTHWPSDVIASFIIGVAWLAALLRALRRSRDLP